VLVNLMSLIHPVLSVVNKGLGGIAGAKSAT
jgi:hypothetical protein